jgi:hypothetical protein
MKRWHDTLLPGELREHGAGRRSARDWLVDVAMWLIAAAIGFAAFVPTASEHGPAMGLLDFALGVVSLVALWSRRARPGEVGALTAAASIASAWAGGAAVIAGFNVENRVQIALLVQDAAR